MIRLLIAAVLPIVLAVVIDKPECNKRQKFFCPDDCHINWENGCPQSCYCKPVNVCPEVSCPADYPICVIVTKRDGCQSCSCKVPFTYIKYNDSRINISFDTHQEFNDDDSDDLGEIVATKRVACTIDSMAKVDGCIQETMNFYRQAREVGEGEPTSINPLIVIDERRMRTLCDMFDRSLSCVGNETLQDCGRDHPDLLELSSLLGFACGPKSEQLFQHTACITDAYRNSRRMQQCEQLFANSLLAVDDSDQISVQARKEVKCKALSWFLRCQRPNVFRHCSEAAADLFVQSFASAVQHTAPECRPDFQRNQFVVDDNQLDVIFALPKEKLPCPVSYQFSVYSAFGSLYQELRSLAKNGNNSKVLPVAFSYSYDDLAEKCKQFSHALLKLPVDVRRQCFRNFQVFDQVYGAFGYACGNSQQFLPQFECLKSAMDHPKTAACESQASDDLSDPSLNQCEIYNMFADCVFPVINDSCGVEGWESLRQLFSVSIRRYVPDCQLESNEASNVS